MTLASLPDRTGWRIGAGLPRSGSHLPRHVQSASAVIPGFSLARVRVHAGAGAAEAARQIGARAFTLGHDIYFGAGEYRPDTRAGRRLLDHELWHAAQQGGASLPPTGAPVKPATPAQEGEARRHAGASGPGAQAPERRSHEPVVALDGTPSVTASTTADRVIEALNRPDPVAGVGDPSAALEILRTLSGQDLIAALIIVDNHFLIDMLVSAIGTHDTTELGAAIYVVRFTSPHGTPDDTFGIQAARGLALLPVDEQDRLIAAVLSGRGSAATVAEVREGMEALQESEATLTAEGVEEVDDPSAAPAPLMAGMAMGPWNPGRVPVPFYIGNSAHIAIAANYAGLHAADAAFYNFSPISSILDAARALGMTVNPAAVTAARLGLRPDITNLTRRHLYEIKPASAQSAAAAEARVYMAVFALAGLPISLGPVTEPGTSGTVPGPGGWYIFTSPEPGVVTYRYRQPRRRRVRVRAPERSPVMSRSFMEEMEAITGLTGAALIIYIIISEGSRVIPIRNAIPVP